MEKNEIIGIRLRQTRIKAGLTLEQLSQCLDKTITKQALSKYEKGLMMPSSATLVKLCNIFNESIDFFLRPVTFNTENVEISFRKKEGIKARALEVLKIQIQDDVERYLEVASIMNDDKLKFLAIKPDKSVLSSKDDMISCAKKVREVWQLGSSPILNIQTLLEKNGINVIITESDKGFDGVSAVVEGNPIMVLNYNIEMTERQRFTAMHELGHILFNAYFAEELSKKERERLCDAFANEMLLPISVIEQEITKYPMISYQVLAYVQANYGISIDAIIHKLKDIGWLNDSKYKSFCIQKNSSSKFKRYVEQSRFIEQRISRLEAMIYNSLSQGLISESKAAMLLKRSEDELHYDTYVR